MSAQQLPSVTETDRLYRPKSTPVQSVHCFSIQAVAEPGVMPRVLELFAKRNLVPKRWHSDVTGPSNQDLSIDLQVTGLDSQTADYVARCLRQVYGVDSVLTSEKRAFV